jgi:glycosyltransferase involved in cell wall biosynthesis
MRIKVLHIIKTLNLGGAESNLLNLVQAFDHKLFDIHVAYSYGGELEGRFRQAGIKLFKFAQKPHKLKSFAIFGITWRLAQYIRREKIDIVHTHTFNAHVWGVLAAKLTGCKILEHVHDSRYMDPSESKRRGETNQQYWFIKFLKDSSDAVVVLTKQNYDFVISQGLYPSKKVRELQNGIDTQDVKILSMQQKEELRKRFDLRPDVKVVLTPIRFSPQKNLKILLEIVLAVRKAMPHVVCLIAGDGPEKEKFEVQLNAHGAQDQIKVIGFYPDIPELLNIVDVFLLPSTIELHSIAIIEAMRQKVPVVVSKDVGCNDEFIRDWDNGVLLDPFSDDGWADALVALFQNESLRRKIGDAGYRSCQEKFDIKDAAKRLEELYQEIVK